MKKITFLAVTLLTIVTLTLTGCSGNKEEAASNEPTVLKVGLHNPESHPLCQGIKEFGEILEEKTDGRYVLDIYYGGQLGNKPTHLQSLQTGVLDITMIMSGPIIDFGAKDLSVFMLPYLYDNVEHARAVLKSDIGKGLLANIQESGTKMVALGAYQESARNFFFTEKPASTIADLQGMKIRAQEGSMYIETMESFGASATPVAFSELYSALQTGVVDGAEQPLSGYYNNKFQEVAKYYLLDKHEISPNLILFSEVTWNKIPDADKKIIQESFEESVSYFNELSDAADGEYLQKMKDEGVMIIEPENPQEWRDAVAPVLEKYGKEYSDIITKIKNTKY